MNFIYFLDLSVSPIDYVIPILVILPIFLLPTAGAIVGIVMIRKTRLRRQGQSKTEEQTDTNTEENEAVE